MGTFRMEQAVTDVALDKIAALANEIWHEHFVPIIGLEQVNYMVGRFQSYPALKDQVKTDMNIIGSSVTMRLQAMRGFIRRRMLCS